MTHDTIIVGAGAAGCILAARLSEAREHRVLLLEAGPDFPMAQKMPSEIRQAYGYPGIWGQAFGYNTRWGWGYRARSTEDNPDIFIPRGRVVGGSSAINAQIFLRGQPQDFDDWAAAGNSEWSYERILPCLKRIESDRDYDDDFHGTDGPIPVRRFAIEECSREQVAFYQAMRDQGMADCPDHNNPQSTGVGPLPLNNAEGIRWSASLGYLTPEVRQRSNLEIRGNCDVRRVVVEHGRAVGVEVLGDTGAERLLAGEVIVSAGAIASPHLLMRSGMGPADHLTALGLDVAADLPGMGQNLRCHAQCALTVAVKPPFRNTGAEPPLQMGCRYTAADSPLRNDMFLHPASCATRNGFYDADDVDPIGFFLVSAIYLAAGSGQVRLRSGDPGERPDLDYNFLAESSDLIRMREGVRKLLGLLGHEQYREIVEGPLNIAEADTASDEALDRWMRRVVATSHHVSGTCKMGPDSDPLAAVDQYGRLKGVRNVRVADASIMHDCIRANTNLTTMMIGERIAEFIAGDR
ncbi:MAG: NAD(P)-binding protein [Gemmatimonadetes bacterium]|jgi:choline dehydrogenase|nr:NAD(P)-binding protein [Gemmatimonadota bacterium]MBT5589573.1 NAD(P)-binding protein [Gemmatimonadota bacterium]MBT5963325.1 NAD(P)-binding protein [Gemmatimonadota bacterium]MBT6628672.1 NAD(P)-binding protein [Gemmatimonadota bacterium]MBT7454176.1 NAD(P)-binding protein [Gemmatimonadota bacterium]